MEALALGRVYARAGLDARAGEAYQRTLALASGGPAVLDALRSLALLARRARRFDEAARLWRQLLEMPRCPANLTREAAEALAIHHEHRVRDLASAHAFALRTLAVGHLPHAGAAPRPAWAAAVRHRVARIERKMTGALDTSARLELGD
jgi:hypothetical protein